MNPFQSLHDYEIYLYSFLPHHKHIPPDLKHHRIPAPGLSCKRPNLVQLIFEVDLLRSASP